MEGWIKLHRKIQDNWLWKEKRKFSKFEAWISLLLKANHKENKILFGNSVINIEAGSFITSEVKLSDEWNWSRMTVRNFLNLLENEKMIVKICTTKYTSITIENWALYQFEEHQNIQQSIQQPIQQSNNNLYTNKNDKNDNNEKNIKKEVVEEKEQQLQQLFIKCTNSTNLNAIEECISYLDDLPYEVIEIALKKTSEKNGGWRYAKTILQNWLKVGIKTIEQVEAEELKFKSKKTNNNTLEERTKAIIDELYEN